MRTSKNVVAEMTFTFGLGEVRSLKSILAQISQGVALELTANDVSFIKEMNKELAAYWADLPRP